MSKNLYYFDDFIISLNNGQMTENVNDLGLLYSENVKNGKPWTFCGDNVSVSRY